MLGALLLSAGSDRDVYRSSTTALLHCNGSNDSTTIADDSTLAANWTAVGNAKLSTTEKKYGTASLILDGASYITPTAAASNFTFGTGDFSVEMWIYPTDLTAILSRVLFDARTAGNQGNYPVLYIQYGTNILLFRDSGVDRITGPTMSVNQWYHLALTRSGTNIRLFVNGTQVGSTYTTSIDYGCRTGGPRIGANANSDDTNNFTGYLDDIRITKGAARYTNTFTPPTELPSRG